MGQIEMSLSNCDIKKNAGHHHMFVTIGHTSKWGLLEKL
jgi:hypothetical protein